MYYISRSAMLTFAFRSPVEYREQPTDWPSLTAREQTHPRAHFCHSKYTSPRLKHLTPKFTLKEQIKSPLGFSTHMAHQT